MLFRSPACGAPISRRLRDGARRARRGGRRPPARGGDPRLPELGAPARGRRARRTRERSCRPRTRGARRRRRAPRARHRASRDGRDLDTRDHSHGSSSAAWRSSGRSRAGWSSTRAGITLARRLMCLSDFDAARPARRRRRPGEGDRGRRHPRSRLVPSLPGRVVHGELGEGRTELATDALELADQLRDDQYRVIALYARAPRRPPRPHRLGSRGRDRGAGDRRRGLGRPVRNPDPNRARLPGAIGRDVAAADSELRDLPAWLYSNGWREPTDFAWANTIEAMIGVGDFPAAEAWLERYEDLAVRSRSPWALATAARSRGLLCEARGDLGWRGRALERALAEHARMDCPFERGRTLLAAGVYPASRTREARGPRDPRRGPPDLRRTRRRSLGRPRKRRAGPHQRTPCRDNGTNDDRGKARRPRRRRPLQQGDSQRSPHQRPHGRRPPHSASIASSASAHAPPWDTPEFVQVLSGPPSEWS